MRQTLLHLPRSFKRLILIATDLVIVESCLLLAFYLRLSWPVVDLVSIYGPVFILTPLFVLLFLTRLELYSAVTRHAGIEIIGLFARGVTFATLAVLLIFFMFQVQPQLPRTVLLMFWAFSIIALATSRLVASRWLHGSSLSSMVMDFAGWQRGKKPKGRAVAIYGAGDAGRQLVGALAQGRRFRPVAFVDDDPALQGQRVAGLKVFSPEDLHDLIASMDVTEVLLAVPSVSRHRRQEIIRFLEPLDVHVRSVPAMDELARGLVKVADIREVDVADILGRESVPADQVLLASSIAGRTILVTGAGGSIGAELCRQILRHKPRKLVLFDHSEYNLYAIASELEETVAVLDTHLELLAVLGSVTDRSLMQELIGSHAIDTLYHAAAYKHVPLVEVNAYQGFINNVQGTLCVAHAAIACGVERFVLVSTDKAVRSSNIMGVTKRLAELVLQGLSQETKPDFGDLPWPWSCQQYQNVPDTAVLENRTCFTMVRFGNVLESSGSVIPKFRGQIQAGGPVTVTDPEVTRYFMTIREAAELVLQASALSHGGDLFILDMGEPIKIDDLARRLIHLSGLSLKDAQHPEGDIEITYSGIRPGEKLYEELLLDATAVATSHSKIWRANEQIIPWAELKTLLVAIDQALRQNRPDAIVLLLTRSEIGYQVSNGTAFTLHGDKH